jgi:hypothetical protein
MNLQKLITEIEDGDVRADLALASTPSALLKRLAESPVLKKAKRQIALDPEAASLLLKQAVALFESPAPEGYAHPGDLALGAYLFLLTRVHGPDTQAFIDRVARTAGEEFVAARTLARSLASNRTEWPVGKEYASEQLVEPSAATLRDT